MPKAAVNPEELRRFAFELKQFNTEVQSQITTVQRRFVRLAESWQDQEQEKFAEIFEKMMRTMVKFIDVSEKHIPFLMRKAERIQEYLDQR